MAIRFAGLRRAIAQLLVVAAAAMHMVPLAHDVRLREATADVIDVPPDLLIVTTGIGFRGWVEAAKGWGRQTRCWVRWARPG